MYGLIKFSCTFCTSQLWLILGYTVSPVTMVAPPTNAVVIVFVPWWITRAAAIFTRVSVTNTFSQKGCGPPRIPLDSPLVTTLTSRISNTSLPRPSQAGGITFRSCTMLFTPLQWTADCRPQCRDVIRVPSRSVEIWKRQFYDVTALLWDHRMNSRKTCNTARLLSAAICNVSPLL